ncbi:hypothetical protein V5799_008105 [Amblyomma americanum]|uniref:Transposable element P transposase-like RNase H domain-containing protein n=1 Tax=Amblyomma americanum TaxID=6943 RepID=A0AAQ4FE73_AMBAM
MSKFDFSEVSQYLTENLQASATLFGHAVFSRKCLAKVCAEGAVCTECKSVRKAVLTRKCVTLRQKLRVPAKEALSQRLKLLKRKAVRLRSHVTAMEQRLAEMEAKNRTIAEEEFTAKVSTFPSKQREAVLRMFKASSRKSQKGMKFSIEWVLECLIMKMKSARLYEHLRRENILALPSKTTLRKYLKRYKTGFRFNSKVLDVLSEKARSMDEFKKHGGLIVDEMKLSEHLSVTAAGHIEGFVDLGPFTSDDDKHIVCDHGMVVMFVPFVGKWTQRLAAFAIKGNIKGSLLTKIMIEAVILAEKAGLKVDFITSDGATWNRRMWTLTGVSESLMSIKCSTPHPVSPKRRLFFLSDFPHLIKCLRNGLLASNYMVPGGRHRSHTDFFREHP